MARVKKIAQKSKNRKKKKIQHKMVPSHSQQVTPQQRRAALEFLEKRTDPSVLKKRKQQQKIKEMKRRKVKPGQLLKRSDNNHFNRHLLIRKLPFQRLVRDILNLYGSQLRIQMSAFHALQQSTQAFVITLFQDANLCTLHSKRLTLMSKDLLLAKRIRGYK